jgi:hypothetical protein
MILPWSFDLRVEVDSHILFLVRHTYVYNISLNCFLSVSYIEILTHTSTALATASLPAMKRGGRRGVDAVIVERDCC